MPVQFPVFEHARWLAEAWKDGPPTHNLGASGFVPEDPLGGLPRDVVAEDLALLDLHAATALRDRLAHARGVEPDAVRIFPGTSAANLATVATLISAGDHVLCERPTYMPMANLAQAFSATVVWHDRAEDGRLDVGAFCDAMTEQTRLAILTSPHNPTGQVLSAMDFARIDDAAAAVGATVLVDQIYRELTDHDLAQGDHTIVTAGFNKCWGAPGLRIGWSMGPAALQQRIEETARAMFLGPPSFGARMGLALLETEGARRRMMEERLAKTHPIYETWAKELGLHPGHGDLIAFPRLGGDTQQLAQEAIREGILLIPGELFGRAGHARIGICTPPDALQEALEAFGSLWERTTAQRF